MSCITNYSETNFNPVGIIHPFLVRSVRPNYDTVSLQSVNKWTERGTVHSAGGVPIGELAHYLLHSFPYSYIIKTVKQLPL